MTREEAIKELSCIADEMPSMECADWIEAISMAIKALEPKTIQEIQAESEKYQKAFEDGYEQGYAQARFDYEQEPCEDAISRKEVQEYIAKYLSQYLYNDVREAVEVIDEYIGELPSVKPQEPKLGHCKECKYFEYDSVANVDGISLIVAHEICKRWGNGCKTKEDGYCFMFEPQEREEV